MLYRMDQNSMQLKVIVRCNVTGREEHVVLVLWRCPRNTHICFLVAARCQVCCWWELQAWVWHWMEQCNARILHYHKWVMWFTRGFPAITMSCKNITLPQLSDIIYPRLPCNNNAMYGYDTTTTGWCNLPEALHLHPQILRAEITGAYFLYSISCSNQA